MKLSYFPGCSLHGTAKEYGLSTEAICQKLGLELIELPDWNCCGASSGHSTNSSLSHAIAARNLILAERQGLDLAVACAACFSRFKKTNIALKDDVELKKKMGQIMGTFYKGSFEIKHLLDVICNTIGLETIKKRVINPLKGLKVVSYYGCVIVRPHEVTAFDNPERPQALDDLMEAIGAESLFWSGKTECCGASLSLTRANIVVKLANDIIEMAHEAGAKAIVTACPLCQANLDMRPQMERRMPVFYFTEILGLALGIDSTLWLKRHLTDPLPLLKSLNLLGEK
jgi:heterodisulfide reductase subunit B